MSPEWPGVTVLVCAYNYEEYLAEAIGSALAQDYPGERSRSLVVDDGSTDRTPEVLAGYGDRIRVVRQENAGLNAATARGDRGGPGRARGAARRRRRLAAGEGQRSRSSCSGPAPTSAWCTATWSSWTGRAASSPRPSTGSSTCRPPSGAGALGALLRANSVPAPAIMFRRALAGRHPARGPRRLLPGLVDRRADRGGGRARLPPRAARPLPGPRREHGGRQSAARSGSPTSARTTGSAAGCCASCPSTRSPSRSSRRRGGTTT